jgi:hypothetical protein
MRSRRWIEFRDDVPGHDPQAGAPGTHGLLVIVSESHPRLIHMQIALLASAAVLSPSGILYHRRIARDRGPVNSIFGRVELIRTE